MMRIAVTVFCFAVVGAIAGCGSKNTGVIIDTSEGPIKVELFDSAAPITTKNFLKYVDEKHYDGTVFHLVKNGNVQGGIVDINLNEKPGRGAPIRNESSNGKSNKRGAVAMMSKDGADSATVQFFINGLDHTEFDAKPGAGNEGFAVFGQVIDGMLEVDRIKRGKADENGLLFQPILIKSIRRSGNK
jgi:cyclophilin family peptidyl-prolyl cis-trans isomerase